MPAPATIKPSEVTWHDRVRIQFGFTGLNTELGLPIVRKLLSSQWPTIRRDGKQCVYVVRILGDVAMAYPKGNSPVIYIGEGDAYSRLYSHAKWITSLLLNVPNIEIEVRIALVVRKKRPNLYKHVEADLIMWFSKMFGAVPLMNSQRETAHENKFTYLSSVKQGLLNQLRLGKGTSYHWAMKPIGQNELHEVYLKGMLKPAKTKAN